MNVLLNSFQIKKKEENEEGKKVSLKINKHSKLRKNKLRSRKKNLTIP